MVVETLYSCSVTLMSFLLWIEKKERVRCTNLLKWCWRLNDMISYYDVMEWKPHKSLKCKDVIGWCLVVGWFSIHKPNEFDDILLTLQLHKTTIRWRLQEETFENLLSTTFYFPIALLSFRPCPCPLLQIKTTFLQLSPAHRIGFQLQM